MKQQTNFSNQLLRGSLTMAFFLAACGTVLTLGSRAEAYPPRPMMRMLANMEDIVSLNSAKDNSLRIFLSYTGSDFNHCGVAVRHSTYADVQAIADTIVIRAKEGGPEIGVVKNGRYVAELSPDIQGFGADFIFETRDGTKLSTTLAVLNGVEATDAVVEILPCH